MSKLRPMPGFLVVQRSEENNKTAGGIILAGNALNDRTNVATVVAYTPQPDVEEQHFKTGDEIVFIRGAGQVQKISGRDFILLREADVISVIE